MRFGQITVIKFISPWSTQVDRIVRSDTPVLQQGDHSRCFDYRSRFTGTTDSKILVFNIYPVLSGQVGDCFDIPGFHFHQDSRTVCRLAFLHLFFQGMLHDILIIHIYRGHDIVSIYRFLTGNDHPGPRHHPLYPLSAFALQLVFKSSFQSYPSFPFPGLRFVQITDCPAG